MNIAVTKTRLETMIEPPIDRQTFPAPDCSAGLVRLYYQDARLMRLRILGGGLVVALFTNVLIATLAVSIALFSRTYLAARARRKIAPFEHSLLFHCQWLAVQHAGQTFPVQGSSANIGSSNVVDVIIHGARIFVSLPPPLVITPDVTGVRFDGVTFDHSDVMRELLSAKRQPITVLFYLSGPIQLIT